MVKDAVGVVLECGDKVVYINVNMGLSMREGNIMYLTSQGARIMPKHSNYELNRLSAYIVKISDAEFSHDLLLTAKLIRLQQDYIKMLGEEIDSMSSIAATHGWVSKNIKIGERLRKLMNQVRGAICGK